MLHARTVVPLVLVVSLVSALAAIAIAGSTTPPPGPVAGTMKTLNEVEARTAINSVNTPGDSNVTYRITQPGSYYLTENLIGEPGKVGLAIAASDVTVDLNGFALLGQGVGTTAISVTTGGMISLPQENVVVRNGHIRNWNNVGVFGAFIYGVLEDLSIDNNGGEGIFIPPVGALQVRDCRITRNASDGVFNEGFHTVLERCLIADNNNHGVNSTSSSLTILRTRVVGNQFSGVVLNGEATIQDSFIMDNRLGWGIEAYQPSHIARNVIRGNGWENDPQFVQTGGVLAESRIDIRGNNFGRNVGFDVDAQGRENFVADNFFGTQTFWNTKTGANYSSFFIRNFYSFGPEDYLLGLDPGVGQLVSPDNVELDDRPHSNYSGVSLNPPNN